jgi:hypothetical protein
MENHDGLTPIQKCRAIYKGDVIAGSFYLLTATVMIGASIVGFNIGHTFGHYYLSVGLLFFGLLAFGKGIFVMYIYNTRLNYYQKIDNLSEDLMRDEVKYTNFRLEKKARNRRRYIYTVIMGFGVIILSFFTPIKGLILGSSIPIVLFAALEFCIGLLTEFRLWEYTRGLSKEIGVWEE